MNKKAISKIGNFWIADKTAISKDLVLTIGFVILAVMTIFIGLNLVAPLTKSEPEYVTFSVAKMIDSALAAPENVTITTGIRGRTIWITGDNKICTSVPGPVSVSQPPEYCKWTFQEDKSLTLDVKKDKIKGKVIIKKNQNELILDGKEGDIW